MSLAYKYSGTAANTSAEIQKRTNYGQPVTLFVTGTDVAVDAVKILVKNHLDVFEAISNLQFGAGKYNFTLPTGVVFKVDVNNGGVNSITVDLYT